MKASRFLPLALLAAPLAQAHPGHGPADLAAGLVHPFTGFDHLLAMVAVGLWAFQLGGRARWALPAAFVAAMAVGAVSGIAGFVPPGVEWAILASVFIFGLLIAGAARLPLVAGVALVSLAGAFHGFAHGAELPAQSGALQFLGGMIVGTAFLHAVGLAAGLLARRHSLAAVRWAGAGILAAGLVFCLA